MKSTLARALVFSCLVTSAVYATPRRLLLIGTGRSNEADQASADSEAFNAAQVNANAQCPGTIEDNNYQKVYDFCMPATDADGNQTWMCAVNVRVVCDVGR